ncbi:MAG: ATP-binding cassette domain-containing protein, partial [Dermatophilaceae bacterium]
MTVIENSYRIEMVDIHKSFGAIEALRGVNLRIAPGEVVGLVGDNGAGKSVLMKILAGRMSRVPWNFGSGPMIIRLRSRSHHDGRHRQSARRHAAAGRL